MKFCHLQLNGWNWRTLSSVKLAKLRRPKIKCSPTYVDYRPEIKADIIGNESHTKGRTCTGGIGKGKET
jgi:hypothetical protein